VAVYFFDSSALVKRYVTETGTAWVISVLDPGAANAIYLARIAGVEVVSAIARRARGGDITLSDGAAAIGQFRHEFATTYCTVEINQALIARAMDVAESRALRGYDVVQLAAAMEVNAYCLALGILPLTLVSSDAALNAAAVSEGLIVEDPNTHP